MLLWMGDASVHELYTAACGLYFIWLVCRVGSVLLSWVPLGWKGVAGKVFEWVLLVSTLRNVQCLTFNKGYYFRILDQKERMAVNFFPPLFFHYVFQQLARGTLFFLAPLSRFLHSASATHFSRLVPLQLHRFSCFPTLGDNTLFPALDSYAFSRAV